jgi:hypothetical protein
MKGRSATDRFPSQRSTLVGRRTHHGIELNQPGLVRPVGLVTSDGPLNDCLAMLFQTKEDLP